jgi:hypothetical protein
MEQVPLIVPWGLQVEASYSKVEQEFPHKVMEERKKKTEADLGMKRWRKAYIKFRRIIRYSTVARAIRATRSPRFLHVICQT